MLSVDERAPYEKMARDHNDRQGYMVEACVDALKVNSQRSWVNLSKVCILPCCIRVFFIKWNCIAINIGYG
jgi:hypothetical protein